MVFAHMRHDSFKEIVRTGNLHLFSIYTDFGAYRRIKWTAGAIAKLAGRHWHCSSEMWNLDSLAANERMKKMLADDGASSDALIVVVGSLDQQRPDLVEWLESLAPLAPGRFGLLIGLLGEEEDQGRELDWTAKQLIRCAQKINRTFIWHWMGHHAMDSTDWLTDSVHALVAAKRVMPPVQMLPGPEIFREAALV